MKKASLFKIFSLVFIVCAALIFASCASEEASVKENTTENTQVDKQDANSAEKSAPGKEAEAESIQSGDEKTETKGENAPVQENKPPMTEEEKMKVYENATIIAPEPKEETKSEAPAKPQAVTDNKITPDVSAVQVKPASAGVTPTPTEESFIEAFESYANPNGNEYDALSVLGSFRYPEDESALLERFKSVSADWHTEVRTQVGENCVVDMSIKEKKAIDLSDAKVTQWNSANGKTAEAYSNIKCIVGSNYSSDTVTMSIDVVKVDGNWYCASTSAIDNLKKTLTTHIFK